MDYFALLELPHQPWLDVETVKANFQRLAATAHPDAGGGSEKFAELNAAWQALRDPVARLRHFLELEQPAALALARETAGDLGDVFMEIAETRQAAQQFAGKRGAALSPLAKALLEPERRVLVERVEKLAAEVGGRMRVLESLLQEWADAELGRILGALTFLSKWDGELRELLLGLK